MTFLKCCGRICVVFDMLVLIPYLALAPRTFPVDTHDLSDVLWAYLCSVGYAGANTIFGSSTTHIPSGHT